MPGTVVLLHYDIAVVVDADVLIRRAVQQSLAGLGLSVQPVIGLGRCQVAAAAKPHPSELLARQLRDCCHQRRLRSERPRGEKQSVSPAKERVLELLKDGCSNKRIATELSLSQRTVESHLHPLFRKLQVSNRTELVLAAA